MKSFAPRLRPFLRKLYTFRISPKKRLRSCEASSIRFSPRRLGGLRRGEGENLSRCQIMRQLFSKISVSGTALQKPFASECILSFKIRLCVNQLPPPRLYLCSTSTLFVVVLFYSSLQITGTTYVPAFILKVF